MITAKSIDHITSADALLVGSKAYNCAQLKRAGFSVPNGIALMGSKETPGTLVEIEDWLGHLPDDTLLAVRSSATEEDSLGYSFAGIYETQLNVKPIDVIDAVRRCRASAYSQRAQAYRTAMSIANCSSHMGVLIQEMIACQTSGVGFTMNPVTGAQDEIVVNAAWGLPDVLIGSRVSPDEFRVRKSDRVVLSRQVGVRPYTGPIGHSCVQFAQTNHNWLTMPSLSDGQLYGLTSLLIRVEQFFTIPQDVEWCFDGARFWVLQSRPVPGHRTYCIR